MNRIPNIVVDLIRSRGVNVVVTEGAWERGSDFPRGIYGGMLHHWGPSAATPGRVKPGHSYPRSQGGLRTDNRIVDNWFADRDGTLFLIAAGAANYASCYGDPKVLEEIRTDTWPGGTAKERGITKLTVCGNKYLWNMEAEHPGDGSPMPDVQELAIAVLVAAMCEVLDQSIRQVIGHTEWRATKPDPRWEGPGNRMPAIRAEAQNILDGGLITPIPPQETDMMQMPPTISYGDGYWNTTPPRSGGAKPLGFYVENAQALLALRGFIDENSEDDGSIPADGKFGHGTETAVKDFQVTVDLAADGTCGPMTWTALLLAE